MYTYTAKKGDTLNSIAQAHGFSNYKEAGVTSVQSGNFDLITPGESIALSNYDPSKVKPITESSPVVSSKDGQGEFNTNSSKVDGLTQPPSPLTPTPLPKPTEGADTSTGFKTNADTNKPEGSTGNPVTDYFLNWEAEQKAKLQKSEADKTAMENQLKATSLAANDSNYQAVVSNIEASYAKRMKEQTRINDVNIARVKAYGLGGATATVNPIEYTDVVSKRETEAADAITALDNERNSLIAQAKAARDSGEAKILRDTLDNISKVEEETRQKTKDLYDEVDRNTKLWQQARTDAETKHKEAVAKMVSAASTQFLDKFSKAKTEEEKDKIVKEIMSEYGVLSTDSDTYFALYQGLGSAVATSKKAALDTKKTEADIKATEALASQRNADALVAWRKANGVDTTEESTMKKDLPDTFASKDDAESKKQEFVAKYGEKGRKYWDAIFLNENGAYKYQLQDTSAPSTADEATVKKDTMSAGYDYDALIQKGYTVDDIAKFLKTL